MVLSALPRAHPQLWGWCTLVVRICVKRADRVSRYTRAVCWACFVETWSCCKTTEMV